MTSRLAILLLVVALATTAGCASSRAERDAAASVQRLFEQSTRRMGSGNFASAISGFETLVAIYPFSEEARQSQLHLLYAYYRNEQPDSVVTAADQFMLENPTHPRVDYALYMKGLARFPANPGILEGLFRVDMDKRPTGDMQASFNTFAQLLQQHPDSEYAQDARQRMIYIRNRLAAHEYLVAEFYHRRDAHVAAINRVRHILENYQETPSVLPALRLMVQCYESLDMPELAAETRRVIELNRTALAPR